MITARKLEIFEKYRGEIDAWACTAPAEDKRAMCDADWYEIGALVQDLASVRSGRVSAAFVERVERRLHEQAGDEALVQALRRLVAE